MRKIKINTLKSVKSTIPEPVELTFSDFYNTFIKAPIRSDYTQREYEEGNAQFKSDAKDLGCYLPCSLNGLIRKKEGILSRNMLTYDIDDSNQTRNILDKLAEFGFTFILHTTRSHTKQKPRHRILFETSRDLLPKEYEAVSRRFIKSLFDLDFLDPSTHQVSRVMHFPSVHFDALNDYESFFMDGKPVDVDLIISTFEDVTDRKTWDYGEKENPKFVLDKEKKKYSFVEPEERPGYMGAFCKKYTIQKAIEQFLPEVYKRHTKTRYTYTKGSSAGGAVIYDNKYMYSFHSTDPARGRSLNAYQLVCFHLFGDPKSTYNTDKMDRMCRGKGIEAPPTPAVVDIPKDILKTEDWKERLERSEKGKILSTTLNLLLIFKNDDVFAGVFAYDDFYSGIRIVKNSPIFRQFDDVKKASKKDPVTLKDIHESYIRNYLSIKYSLKLVTQTYYDCILQTAKDNRFHPIKEIIEQREWDGIKRVDNVLIDLFGIEDTPYHREISRKIFLGLVARAYSPGIKFDMVPVFLGAQGIGKSTFVSMLAYDSKYLNSSFRLTDSPSNAEAVEAIRGKWVVEIAELDDFKRKTSNRYKSFLTQTSDSKRMAYDRRTDDIKRTCIFIGTTNDDSFLKEPGENRRYYPVNLGRARGPVYDAKEYWDTFKKNLQQLYAEALYYFKRGETFEMTKEAEDMAKGKRLDHFDVDIREGLISAFMQREVPENWRKMKESERMAFHNNPLAAADTDLVPRDAICCYEVIVECLGYRKTEIKRHITKDVKEIMDRIAAETGEWEYTTSSLHFEAYGKQKYYKRIK